MSQSTRNKPETETQLLRQIERLISFQLPPGWSAEFKNQPGERARRADAVIRVTAPDGATTDFIVEAKRSRTPQSLQEAIKQLLDFTADQTNGSGLRQLFIASPYLSPRSREMLKEQGISYGDATGNLRLLAAKPGLFVQVSGAEKDPWPDDLPLQSLRGRGAARAIRAILDFRPPYGIRELAQKSRVSTATLSRVVDLLEREALLTKDSKRRVEDVDWAGVIKRWSDDYEFRRSNNVTTYLEPRGLREVTSKLREVKWPYAITGSAAAQRFAPIAPARSAVLYVQDSVEAASQLGLRETDSGANVLLAEPYDSVVFERTQVRDDLVIVSPTQLAVDLLTGSGRDPSAAEELLIWMKRNEDEWRSQP